MNSPAIASDTFVTISYALYEDGKSEPIDMGGDNPTETGEASFIEQAGSDRFHCRVSFVHGYGLVVPALEKGLEGETANTTVSILAEPTEAFGDYEPDGVFEIDKEGLEGVEEIEIGDEVLASSADGDMMMRVIGIGDETLKVDTNHPLAGKRVRFEVDIIEVRAATDEEIEEAQDDYEDLTSDACGCGESHGDEHDHDHAGHDHAGHDHSDHGEASAPDQLVQLARKPS